MIQQIRNKDKFFTIALNILESTILNIIMRAFVKSIINFNVKKEAIRDLIVID